jgi:hypothetical protein
VLFARRLFVNPEKLFYFLGLAFGEPYARNRMKRGRIACIISFILIWQQNGRGVGLLTHFRTANIEKRGKTVGEFNPAPVERA